jgi:hypothetical protein
MGDFKKIGWIIVFIIIYWGWVYLIKYILDTTGFEPESTITVIILFAIQFVGGIVPMVYIHDYVTKKI